MPEISPEHRTYDQGAREAIALAIATMVGLLPQEKQVQFILGFPKNVETWENQALPSSEVADEWLTGFQEMAASIQALARR